MLGTVMACIELGGFLAGVAATWFSHRAARLSKPTGNGFATRVEAALVRIEGRQERFDERAERLDTKVERVDSKIERLKTQVDNTRGTPR